MKRKQDNFYYICNVLSSSMAKPIKETPVLKGKEAVKFIQKMKETEKLKVSKSVKTRMKKNYNELNSIAQF